MTKRKNYSSEFKQEAARLILDQNYTYKEAGESMGVGQSALRRWVNQLKSERQGTTPEIGQALTVEKKEIQQLKTRIRQLEREKEILKKASALLMSDQYHNIV